MSTSIPADYPALSAEEAAMTWASFGERAKVDDEIGKLMRDFKTIELECRVGWRCGVCGRFDSPDCSEEC